mmetsp:Transcript_778/g.2419  ORF Transcript_778/g.2419 Transcript_778/m.2419 type:complete len:913 (+) Transcript_778:682-3420(+)
MGREELAVASHLLAVAGALAAAQRRGPESVGHAAHQDAEVDAQRVQLGGERGGGQVLDQRQRVGDHLDKAAAHRAAVQQRPAAQVERQAGEHAHQLAAARRHGALLEALLAAAELELQRADHLQQEVDHRLVGALQRERRMPSVHLRAQVGHRGGEQLACAARAAVQTGGRGAERRRLVELLRLLAHRDAGARVDGARLVRHARLLHGAGKRHVAAPPHHQALLLGGVGLLRVGGSQRVHAAAHVEPRAGDGVRAERHAQLEALAQVVDPVGCEGGLLNREEAAHVAGLVRLREPRAHAGERAGQRLARAHLLGAEQVAEAHVLPHLGDHLRRRLLEHVQQAHGLGRRGGARLRRPLEGAHHRTHASQHLVGGAAHAKQRRGQEDHSHGVHLARLRKGERHVLGQEVGAAAAAQQRLLLPVAVAGVLVPAAQQRRPLLQQRDQLPEHVLEQRRTSVGHGHAGLRHARDDQRPHAHLRVEQRVQRGGALAAHARVQVRGEACQDIHQLLVAERARDAQRDAGERVAQQRQQRLAVARQQRRQRLALRLHQVAHLLVQLQEDAGEHHVDGLQEGTQLAVARRPRQRRRTGHRLVARAREGRHAAEVRLRRRRQRIDADAQRGVAGSVRAAQRMRRSEQTAQLWVRRAHSSHAAQAHDHALGVHLAAEQLEDHLMEDKVQLAGAGEACDQVHHALGAGRRQQHLALQDRRQQAGQPPLVVAALLVGMCVAQVAVHQDGDREEHLLLEALVLLQLAQEASCQLERLREKELAFAHAQQHHQQRDVVGLRPAALLASAHRLIDGLCECTPAPDRVRVRQHRRGCARALLQRRTQVRGSAVGLAARRTQRLGGLAHARHRQTAGAGRPHREPERRHRCSGVHAAGRLHARGSRSTAARECTLPGVARRCRRRGGGARR